MIALALARNLDVDESGDNMVAHACILKWYYCYNAAASVRYLKFYDKATDPLVTDTPKITLPIPAGAAANVAFDDGVCFITGLGVRATTGVADADAGAPSGNDVVLNVGYEKYV